MALRPSALAALALAALATPAGAAELIFGAQGSGAWDSNVLNAPSGLSDFFFRGGPTARLRDTRGDVTYDLFYRPEYRVYVDEGDLDGWEHFVNGSLGFRLGPRTKISIREQYFRLLNATSRLEQVGDATLLAESELVPVIGSQEAHSNTASLSVDHFFSSTWLGQLVLSNDLYDPDPEELVDSISTVGQASLLYVLSARDRIGGGVGVTFQQFGSTDVQPETQTRYYQVFANWNHEFSPTWSFELQAGPTLVDPEEQDFPDTTTLDASPYVINSAGGVSRLVNISACPPRPDGLRLLDDCRVTNFGTQTFPIGGVDQGFGVVEALTTPTLAEIFTSAVVPVTGQPDPEGSSLTYFASVYLRKRWMENLDTVLSYRRNAGSSGGFGGATLLDQLVATGTWKPTERWNVVASAGWLHRSSSATGTTQRSFVVIPAPAQTDVFLFGALVPGAGSSFDVARLAELRLFSGRTKQVTDQWYATLRADHQITKRFSVFARAIYLYQSRENQSVTTTRSRYDSLTTEIGLSFQFEPIDL